ncbi:uncharacterized protein [Nicotiana tomentosiformis]|uniref:uncharacterized protein n=1 Tax=Nicotiana tomentosiformis TaxID=4098 RepID=UPI00388CBD8F
MNAIIWNVRSVNTKKVFERLFNMQRRHHFQFIGIIEPMQKSRKLERYRRQIGMLQAFANISNKIWVFVDEDHGVDVIINMEQQLTLKLTNMDTRISFIVTFVYAKCDATERIELWDSLYSLASDMSLPWLVGGYFNVIWDEEEKFGGLPVHMNEVLDFRNCVNTCNLIDLGFKGSLEITHLLKIGSDHCPMMLSINASTVPIKKAFKFLNFWTKHASFKAVVAENWTANFHANPFTLFNHKLKRVKKALSIWSRVTYGNIFQNITSLEEVVLVHEEQFELNPSYQNRERLMKVQAEMIKYLSLEEEFWKQKSGMSCFKDRDRNTKLFHAQVNGRRKRLELKRIQNSEGNWIDDHVVMAEEAVKIFSAQFHEDKVPNAFSILDHIPYMVSDEQNDNLMRQPTKIEVQDAIFGLNGNSAGGPDGFTGCFFHTCWDIIGDDVYDMVRAFFSGQSLPKVIHERLANLLPNLISDEQTGFVKGRSIVENVLLTE